ncbi:MAG: GatB/YqeY domain-containing protein [Patescibacteria group bacterium]|nr:GatB/YqeY domain-containing protein [Patescibacteria group bacterium]
MSLKEKIEQDFIEAFKSKNTDVAETLKLLKSSIKNKEIELIKILDEAELIKVLMTEAKKRRDSIEQFKNGGREDLAQKEQVELSIIEKYLPEMMSEDEVKKIICAIIESSGEEKLKSNFGKFMKLVMAELNGRADGSLVSKILNQELN